MHPGHPQSVPVLGRRKFIIWFKGPANSVQGKVQNGQTTWRLRPPLIQDVLPFLWRLLSLLARLQGHATPALNTPPRAKIQHAEMAAFNVVFTVFSGIGFVISVIPLWWHVQSWDMHVGTCMYMVWTALGCLVHFVDSIVWNGNAINWAPVWCDICYVQSSIHPNITSH